jgi:hypothetical protein
MHEVLFENQRALAETDLARYAQPVGLDRAKFERDTVGHEYA